jgi:hypothetical protein
MAGDDRSPAAKKANYTGGRPKDESNLSQRPGQIRVRLRRAKKSHAKVDGRVDRDIEMLYKKAIEDWDVEELARGRPRSKDGSFRGVKPSWVTAAVQTEARKRLLDETFGKMAGHIDQAIKTVAELMVSEEVDDKGKPIVDARTKLTAATFILEHFIGKPTAVVAVEANDFTKQAIAAAIVLDDGRPEDHFILEGDYEINDEEEAQEDANG